MQSHSDSRASQASTSNSRESSIIVNAMTIDVEDYFQVSAFERHIDFSEWEDRRLRVDGNTDRILDILDEAGISATFFVLGWVAERVPRLIRRISEAGHEVASHGYRHIRVTQQSSEDFRCDVLRTKKLLEDTSGSEVLGYRAASYSIDESNLWALDVLGEVGYRYSSSIYPVKHDLYGMPNAPRFAFPAGQSRILEVPVSTVRMFNRNWPCGGGGYFRLFPYAFSRWAIDRINTRERRAAVFYFHPWEIDPDQPKVDGIGWKTRFRHYHNLDRFEDRWKRLLAAFQWGRMDEVFGLA
jgi:polysaccharide deacetylase family protein (PEP-CTERM system associated)